MNAEIGIFCPPTTRVFIYFFGGRGAAENPSTHDNNDEDCMASFSSRLLDWPDGVLKL